MSEDLLNNIEEYEKEIEKLKIIEEKYKDSQLYIKDFKDEIERLNNIINELESHLEKEISKWSYDTDLWTKAQVQEDRIILNKLQELKGSDK